MAALTAEKLGNGFPGTQSMQRFGLMKAKVKSSLKTSQFMKEVFDSVISVEKGAINKMLNSMDVSKKGCKDLNLSKVDLEILRLWRETLSMRLTFLNDLQSNAMSKLNDYLNKSKERVKDIIKENDRCQKNFNSIYKEMIKTEKEYHKDLDKMTSMMSDHALSSSIVSDAGATTATAKSTKSRIFKLKSTDRKNSVAFREKQARKITELRNSVYVSLTKLERFTKQCNQLERMNHEHCVEISHMFFDGMCHSQSRLQAHFAYVSQRLVPFLTQDWMKINRFLQARSALPTLPQTLWKYCDFPYNHEFDRSLICKSEDFMESTTNYARLSQAMDKAKRESAAVSKIQGPRQNSKHLENAQRQHQAVMAQRRGGGGRGGGPKPAAGAGANRTITPAISKPGTAKGSTAAQSAPSSATVSRPNPSSVSSVGAAGQKKPVIQPVPKPAAVKPAVPSSSAATGSTPVIPDPLPPPKESFSSGSTAAPSTAASLTTAMGSGLTTRATTASVAGAPVSSVNFDDLFSSGPSGMGVAGSSSATPSAAGVSMTPLVGVSEMDDDDPTDDPFSELFNASDIFGNALSTGVATPSSAMSTDRSRAGSSFFAPPPMAAGSTSSSFSFINESSSVAVTPLSRAGSDDATKMEPSPENPFAIEMKAAESAAAAASADLFSDLMFQSSQDPFPNSNSKPSQSNPQGSSGLGFFDDL